MKRKIAIYFASGLCVCAAAIAACADDADTLYVPPAFATSGNTDFDVWRTDFASRAVNIHHKDAAIIEAMLIGLTPNETVTRLNDSQPEVVRPIWSYLNSALNQARINQGQALYLEHKDKLANASQSTGVPAELAIAIWGMESAYGANKGSMDVVRALATFAYKGRRVQLGETELLAVADILKSGDASRETLIGSWAGAMGHTQFMPTSYLSRAIDGDGDGKKDIWNDPDDALASTLNFLKIAGWKQGEPWGREVQIAPDFDYSLADGTMHPLSFWRQNGMISPFADVPDDWMVRMFVPAGANGPKFLVGANYQSIRSYNASDSYALSVALLSDFVVGKRNAMPNNWPVDDPPLRRTDAMEMQNYLTRLGYDIGTIDGAPGQKTKAALQAFQKSKGFVADGYPSMSALLQLRNHFGIAPPAQQPVTPSGPEPVHMFGPPTNAVQVPAPKVN